MRKYRFSSLIGNTTTLNLLKRSLTLNTFKKFTIFGGVLGTGKSTCAGIAAMTLTCENPVGGEPCLECQACKANKRALEEVGVSPYVKVVNMGKSNKFEDIESLIKDVFVLQGGGGKQVYIFEEAHAIKNVRGGFTAFLAEIDKMPQGVYVIMCTTAVHDIPMDLRSRAITFNFNRLNKQESTILANNLVKNSNVKVSAGMIAMIVRHSKGIPRDIEKLIEFTVENVVSEDEMRDYLQEVSPSSFISLLNAMKYSRFDVVIEQLEDLLDLVDSHKLVNAMCEFFINAAFLIDGGVKGDFTSSESGELRNLVSSSELKKIIQIMESLRKDNTESGVKLAVMKIRNVLQGTTMVDVVTTKASTAAKEKVEASRVAERNDAVQKTGKLKPLTTKSLDQFG